MLFITNRKRGRKPGESDAEFWPEYLVSEPIVYKPEDILAERGVEQKQKDKLKKKKRSIKSKRSGDKK